MFSRRGFLKATFGTCAAYEGSSLASHAGPARAREPVRMQGAGYELYFIGAQRETVMNGKLAAAIDLRELSAARHLYAIGPIEQLRGEVTVIDSRPSLSRVGSDGAVQVTESFEAGAPFLVWAQVPQWQSVAIPSQVRSFPELEAFVPRWATALGLDAPIPFLVRGRQGLIDFHILNRIGHEPHDAQKHKAIQASFELHRAEATIVGFYSPAHRGIFTSMDATIHLHFQTPDNTSSGHIQTLEIGPDTVLSLPRG